MIRRDSAGSVHDTVVVVVTNKKGGVGKTTTTHTLGAALGRLGKKVLLADVDPSGGLTEGAGIPPKGFPTLYDVVASLGTEDKEEVVHATDAVIESDSEISLPENVHLIPASENLVLVEKLADKDDWFSFQDMLLEPINELRGLYDYILIDTPPNVSRWTPAALKACDFALLTCIPEHYAVRALSKAMADIRTAQKRGNPELKLLGIVVSNIPEPRTRLARHLVKHVEENCVDRDGKPFKFTTEISRTVTLQEAQSLGQTVFEYDPAHKVCDEYRNLAREVEERVSLASQPLLHRLGDDPTADEVTREVHNG